MFPSIVIMNARSTETLFPFYKKQMKNQNMFFEFLRKILKLMVWITNMR